MGAMALGSDAQFYSYRTGVGNWSKGDAFDVMLPRSEGIRQAESEAHGTSQSDKSRNAGKVTRSGEHQ
jgi:hypothetical protein